MVRKDTSAAAAAAMQTPVSTHHVQQLKDQPVAMCIAVAWCCVAGLRQSAGSRAPSFSMAF
jgi:hypothetical protein